MKTESCFVVLVLVFATNAMTVSKNNTREERSFDVEQIDKQKIEDTNTEEQKIESSKNKIKENPIVHLEEEPKLNNSDIQIETEIEIVNLADNEHVKAKEETEDGKPKEETEVGKAKEETEDMKAKDETEDVKAKEETVKPDENSLETEECKNYYHRVFICKVTVFYKGSFPDINILKDDDQTKELMRPKLCGCPEAYANWFCPSYVHKLIDDFSPKKLCKQ